jgi:hypothetical protein
LAKPNYQYEKRQREMARKKKQNEKRQRKLEKDAPPPSHPEPGGPETLKEPE